MAYSDASPGAGTRHLESPTNLAYIYVVYVYEVHVYIYMLAGGIMIKSGLNCFFSLTYKQEKKRISTQYRDFKSSWI